MAEAACFLLSAVAKDASPEVPSRAGWHTSWSGTRHLCEAGHVASEAVDTWPARLWTRGMRGCGDLRTRGLGDVRRFDWFE